MRETNREKNENYIKQFLNLLIKVFFFKIRFFF